MPEYVVLKARIATNHPLAAYGGVQLSQPVLDQLAAAVSAGRMPLQVNHDAARRLESRVLSARVVDLDDGFKAVEATYEVKKGDWEAWQQELTAVGARGGMSFSTSTPLEDLQPKRPGATVWMGLHGDAAYFSAEDLHEAAEELSELGPVRVGHLLQFSHAPTCKIIIEYVHESGGLSPASMGLAIGLSLISQTIWSVTTQLLRARKIPADGEPEPPHVELHRLGTPNGAVLQTMKIATDDQEVLKQALDQLIEPAEHPERGVVVWDEEAKVWRPV